MRTSTRSPLPGSPGRLTGRTWKHYRGCAAATKTVLYHLGVLPTLPLPWEQRWPFARRLAAVPDPIALDPGGLSGTQDGHLQTCHRVVSGDPAGPLRDLHREH